MQTPGYEADMNRVVLYNLETKEKRILALDWDRSVASSLTWAVDSMSVYFSADDIGYVRIFKLDIHSGKVWVLFFKGKVEVIVQDGSNSGISAMKKQDGREMLLFRRGTPIMAPEIFQVDLCAGGEKDCVTEKLTSYNDEFLNSLALSKAESFVFQGTSYTFNLYRRTW
jgi:dipeptidyl aminopeptidase/acylaminoacyl peptidase